MPRLKPYVSMHNCIQLLYISQFPSFPFFVISGRPFFNVNKNLGKPILEILLIFLHSFMVNQNEKWWHISNFSSFVDVESLLFFVWSKLAQFGERSRQASQRLPFQQYKRPSQRGTPSQMKRKQKGWDFFWYWNFLCVFKSRKRKKKTKLMLISKIDLVNLGFAKNV